MAASSNLFRPVVVCRHVQSDRSQIPEPKESEGTVDSNCFKIYQQFYTRCVQCVTKLIIFLLSVLGGSTNFGKASLLCCSICCPLYSRQKQWLYHGLKNMNSLPVYLPVHQHGAYRVLQLHWSRICHGAKLRAEGVKSFGFPSVSI